MTKSKKTENATETAVAGAQTGDSADTRIADLSALVEALEARVSALESAPADKHSAEAPRDRAAARRTAASAAASATGGATTDGGFNPALGGATLAPDVLVKYSELQEKRQREAASRASGRVRKAAEPGRLDQLAREFEGANVTSARMRLQDLQTKGTISDFRVLPPGSAMPGDTNTSRILLTTDAHGFIISADVG